jgi:hypothetical protein
MGGRVSYYGNIVKDGLVLDLDAAKLQSYPRTGTLWNDISGFQNNGTLTNGPTFNSANGGSIVFDGIDDWVNVTNSLLFANTTNLTVSIWFNVSSVLTSTTSLIHKGRQEPPRNYWWLAYYGNLSPPRFLWETGDGAGNLNQLPYVFTPSISTWYNVVGTFEPNLSKIYLNGLEVASATTTVASVAANDGIGTYIGTYRSLAYFFPGKLNGALIYRKTLSATEVLQNYNATKGRYL